mmetsp:Transcript_12819/g.10706  ORF Transcript_12819/g.10706 Transcript_12819/m.10706 type:complete len:133 (+) Transcript_12819:76-474(+)
MEDELQEVRDSFYVGAYSRSLQLSEQTVVSSDMVAAEKEALNARCYLAAGMLDHIKGMQHSPNPALKATALMAVFMRTPQEGQRKTALDRIQELATTTRDATALPLVSNIDSVPPGLISSQEYWEPRSVITR